MRFTVTPLGGGRNNITKIVEGIVRYLQPPPATAPLNPTGNGTPGAGGASAYYTDAAEEPGRWLGRAAEGSGLHGPVQTEHFAAVLSGRDPHTGERLISAQGSAGRRDKLGAGNPTRIAPDGALLFDEADAAAVLGVTKAEVSRILDIGASMDPVTDGDIRGRVLDRVLGRVPTSTQFRGAYLTPILDSDGSRWVTEKELTECKTARAAGADPDQLRGLGAPDDQLSIIEAARLTGTTARYMRRLAKYHDDHRPQIEQAIVAGRRPRQAYLVAHRGTRGQWLVTRQNLVEFLERRRPPAVRVGFDVTLTTEKSLGVLALLSDSETSATVLAVIQDANDWGMAWLENQAAHGRIGGKTVQAKGWIVASFRHLTSRALDPFPHHHNVIANTVTLPDGTRRGLDARGLYRHAQAASALATAEMRHQLTSQLGVRWRPGRKSGWEIAGINDQILTEFSTRRNEIDDALRELEIEIGRGAHPGEVDHIVLATRPAKNHTPAQTLIANWRNRANRLGLDAAAIDRLCDHLMVKAPDPGTVFSVLARSDGICANSSVFTRTDALIALANHPIPTTYGPPQPLTVGAERLNELADEFLASQHVIQIGGTTEPVFTTVEMLSVQERIHTRYTTGLNRTAALTNPKTIARVLDSPRHSRMTGEQRALVESWCTSGHRIQTAIGRAGAGKTTTIAACAEAWTHDGYRVLGAAVKGEAARTLATTTGIESETVAWYLTHDDPGRQPLNPRTVLIVDEASTLADRDLEALLAMAERTGATIRLIGDPAQHGAIAAGGMYRVLSQQHPAETPELVTTHRVQNHNDRAAAEALRTGRIEDALNHLQAAGHLHVVEDDLTMYRHVLARWWDAHQNGHQHPMVDRRNSTRRQLNRLAHHLLQANNQIGKEEIVATGDRRFSIGDRITARAPNRQLHPPGNRNAYVRNGALGTITALNQNPTDPHRETITVAFDGIGTIEIPRTFFDHHTTGSGRTEVGIDHAYALTSYAVQGSTHHLSTSRIDATTTRAETYVNITRGRNANHLYLTPTTDPLNGETLPKLPNPPADQSVTERLQRSTNEITAWELAHPTNQTNGQAAEMVIGL